MNQELDKTVKAFWVARAELADVHALNTKPLPVPPSEAGGFIDLKPPRAAGDGMGMAGLLSDLNFSGASHLPSQTTSSSIWILPINSDVSGQKNAK